MKTIILGLGNTILTDDGVGISVVREIDLLLRRRPPVTGHRSPVTITEASAGGFAFIDLLAGYGRAAIVDAIQTKGGRPGEWYELDAAALTPSARLSSLHGIDFATACSLAQRMGIAFPREVAIFAMEVADAFSFGERPTPSVAAAIPQMAAAVVEELGQRGWLTM